MRKAVKIKTSSRFAWRNIKGTRFFFKRAGGESLLIVYDKLWGPDAVLRRLPLRSFFPKLEFEICLFSSQRRHDLICLVGRVAGAILARQKYGFRLEIRTQFSRFKEEACQAAMQACCSGGRRGKNRT